MAALTLETIGHINAYCEYLEQREDAAYYSIHTLESESYTLAMAERGHFTDGQLEEYTDNGIVPPHRVGQETHDSLVVDYFALYGEDPH